MPAYGVIIWTVRNPALWIDRLSPR